MKKRKTKHPTIEELFPNVRARQAADDAIDKLDVQEPMHVYLDTWESAYYAVARKSPFRAKD